MKYMKVLFMGEVEDPELDVWLARGTVQVYDGTRKPTEGERQLLASLPKRPPYTGPKGTLTLTGGGVCVCGRCLFERACPEAPAKP